MFHILVVDDDRSTRLFMRAFLEAEHYTVSLAENGEDALEVMEKEHIDLVVLDIMMPGLDGIQVLQTLRERNIATPVLLLTARGQVEDRIAGLNSGADDYLPKPFNNGELVARVRALTRRGRAYTPQVLAAGNITLDCATFELRCKDQAIALGSKEFQLLELLMRQQGRLISTEQFMERIWGYDSEAEINVVWAYLSYLRRKLEAVGANVRITARRGQGYLLEEIA